MTSSSNDDNSKKTKTTAATDKEASDVLSEVSDVSSEVSDVSSEVSEVSDVSSVSSASSSVSSVSSCLSSDSSQTWKGGGANVSHPNPKKGGQKKDTLVNRAMQVANKSASKKGEKKTDKTKAAKEADKEFKQGSIKMTSRKKPPECALLFRPNEARSVSANATKTNQQ